jgi:hypothetical protein
MENNIAGLIGIGVLVAMSLAALAIYRWRQQKRVGKIDGWVNDYLLVRYGELPTQLSINCSHDTFWPVLVRFHTPGTGIRHSCSLHAGVNNRHGSSSRRRTNNASQSELRQSLWVASPGADG